MVVVAHFGRLMGDPTDSISIMKVIFCLKTVFSFMSQTLTLFGSASSSDFSVRVKIAVLLHCGKNRGKGFSACLGAPMLDSGSALNNIALLLNSYNNSYSHSPH